MSAINKTSPVKNFVDNTVMDHLRIAYRSASGWTLLLGQAVRESTGSNRSHQSMN